jgi:hypothetical protein
MPTCPNCHADLGDAHLESEKCPHCGSLLGPAGRISETVRADSAIVEPLATEPAGEETDSAADDLRLAQTFAGDAMPPLSPAGSEAVGGGQVENIAPTGLLFDQAGAGADRPSVGEPPIRQADPGHSAATSPAAASSGQPIAESPPAGDVSGIPLDQDPAVTAGQKRFAETIEPVPQSEREKITADEQLIAETLESHRGMAVTPVPLENDTAGDDRRVAATIETDSARLQGGAALVDERRYAETFESGGLSPEVKASIVSIWSGKCQPEVTPRTSIKADALPVEGETELVIKPRVFREAKDLAVGQVDYEMIDQLGKGGMGVVYAARQASIDRTVAIKMLKPEAACDRELRGKFLSEAMVTGDLEHPNIVPIYDLGKNEAGALFYAMKRVKGTPWHTVIAEKSFQENLEILMKVADAVGFAHSRGVIHRDLKPENVMLGDYGEVLLMDWGLAISLGARKAKTDLGGTPAYMAPEMSTGPVERIGKPSDIYLLAGILFEMLTGMTPHTGKSVMHCLFAAARNEIQPTDKSGELLAIARKGMATEPEDRYASVAEFQDAVRQYQSHAESVSLSTRADEDLNKAKDKDDYERYSRALFGFQEAYNLWDGNPRAKAGISEATLTYAGSALRKADYDLGLSLLSADNPEHAEIRRALSAAQRERDARQQRLRAARRIGAALVLTVLVVVTVAFFWIRASAQEAYAQRKVAEEQRLVAEQKTKEAVADRAVAVRQTDLANTNAAEAKKQTGIAIQKTKDAEAAAKIAEDQTSKAVQAKKDADTQADLARKQTAIAVAAKDAEEYEAYVARIGLAAAKIDENAFDAANEILAQCPERLRDWEWGRLEHLCTQDIRSFDAQQPVDTVAFSRDGRRFATGGWGDAVLIWDVQSGKQAAGSKPALTIRTGGRQVPSGGQYVYAVAFSPDGKQLATGTNDRPEYVKIWDAQTGALVRTLRGHGDAVLSVVYSRDGKRLLTSSYDKTARLWDLQSGESQIVVGHDWWVWSAEFSPDEYQIVTASQDGSVLVSSLTTGKDGKKVWKAGEPFLGHTGPVYAAVFSPDGKHIASAGHDKRVLLWDPGDVKKFAFESQAGSAPSTAATQEAVVFAGHSADVRSVAFSPDGKLLLTGSYDNTVRVWDVGTRGLLKTLRGHGGRVSACVFAPEGQKVLSGSEDHFAKIWDIAGYEEVRVFQGLVLQGHRDAILGASFSPDGREIATASRDRTARIWDSRSGREIRELKEGHDFLASAAAFFPNEKHILTAAVDNTVRIWDVTTGTQVRVLSGTGMSAAVALSRDGKRILTGSDNKTAKLWDAQSGVLLRELKDHQSEVAAVAISADGQFLFTGDSNGRCRLWDANTGKEKWEGRSHTRGITAAAFLPGGNRVLTASTDNTVAQWDVATGQEQRALVLKHPDAVTSLAISPDGHYVLTSCSETKKKSGDLPPEVQGRLYLWNADTARELTTFVPKELDKAGKELDKAVMPNAVGFSPDGGHAIATASDNTVRLWKLETKHEGATGSATPEAVVDLKPLGGLAWSATFSPDGDYLIIAGGNEARLWDLKNGRESMRFAQQGSVASANFSPDGKRIVTGSWDNTARLWDVNSGVANLKLDGAHTQYVNDAIFSPDGARVLTVSDDKTARIWDAHSGQPLLILEGHEQRVRSGVFSPDGRRVLTASNDKTARIWDAQSGRRLQVLTGHQQAVLCAVFSHDGKYVLTGSEDNTAKEWDAETGKELAFSGDAFLGHTSSVSSVAFSKDDKRAITGSQDHTAKLWDAQTGKEILTLKGHSQEVTCVAFSPDGQSVLTASHDGTAILWLATSWRDRGHPDARKVSRLIRPFPIP